MDELPVVKGLIVCERAEQDRRTGTVSVFGRFNQFRSPAYPSPPRLVSVFVALSNGAGVLPVTLEVFRLDTDELVRADHRSVLFADRLAEVLIVFHLPAFTFPVAGSYEFVLSVGDEPMASHRVHAL
jgi:hypothetical protein